MAPPPIAIALGAGMWQLGTVYAIRRWERRHGTRLVSAGRTRTYAAGEPG